MVFATDPETGETALKEVVQTFVKESSELVHVTVGDEEIVCTNEHPFYSPQRGWTAACELRAGDILVTVNGEYVTVEKVQHEILENPVKVYNFEVAGFHTYFVSESNILVHNLCAKKYYKATRTDNSIIRGSKITKSQALNRIRKGKDVIANSRSAAKALAKDAFGNSKFIKEIHNLPNAMWHYHDKARHFYHVFF